MIKLTGRHYDYDAYTKTLSIVDSKGMLLFTHAIKKHLLQEIRGVKHVVIGEWVISIGDSFLNNIDTLETITFKQQSVRSIGSNFLKDCRKLKEVHLPRSLHYIHDGFLFNCLSIESIRIPSMVTNIPNRFMNNCPQLKNIQLPNQVVTIGDHFLAGALSLRHMDLPEDLLEIKDKFMYRCHSIKSIDLKNVQAIGHGFMNYCYGLVDVTLPPTLKYVGVAFCMDTPKLHKVKLPHDRIQISEYLFKEFWHVGKLSLVKHIERDKKKERKEKEVELPPLSTKAVNKPLEELRTVERAISKQTGFRTLLCKLDENTRIYAMELFSGDIVLEQFDEIGKRSNSVIKNFTLEELESILKHTPFRDLFELETIIKDMSKGMETAQSTL
jgi:hypothetical protein